MSRSRAFGRLTGSVGQVLRLTGVTDAEGVAQVAVPASFVAQAGNYVVFASLDEATLTAVAIYEASLGKGEG